MSYRKTLQFISVTIEVIFFVNLLTLCEKCGYLIGDSVCGLIYLTVTLFLNLNKKNMSCVTCALLLVPDSFFA